MPFGASSCSEGAGTVGNGSPPAKVDHPVRLWPVSFIWACPDSGLYAGASASAHSNNRFVLCGRVLGIQDSGAYWGGFCWEGFQAGRSGFHQSFLAVSTWRRIGPCQSQRSRGHFQRSPTAGTGNPVPHSRQCRSPSLSCGGGGSAGRFKQWNIRLPS